MKKAVILIQIFFHGILRRAVWVILLSFGLLFSIGCYMFVYGKEPVLAINQMVYGQAVLTFVFMMLGIENSKKSVNNSYMSDADGLSGSSSYFFGASYYMYDTNNC